MRFQLTETERTERWAVDGVPPATDGRRAQFRPEYVKLTYRGDEPWFVEIHGKNTRTGRPTSTNYCIDNGQVQPDSRTGDAPEWLADLLDVSLETPPSVTSTDPITPPPRRVPAAATSKETG